MPKVMKQKKYQGFEVVRTPKDVKWLRLECLLGGFFTLGLKRSEAGYALYIEDGGGTFRIRHTFKTRNEAIFYAQGFFNTEAM